MVENKNIQINNGQSQQMPMKWHNFLVYAGFLLGILSGIVNVVNIIKKILGSDFSVATGFKLVYIAEIILILCWCAALGYVWKEMRQKKKNAWKKYLACIVGIMAIHSLGQLVFWVMIKIQLGGTVGGTSAFIINIIIYVISCAISVALNYIYYKKRDHLFVN